MESATPDISFDEKTGRFITPEQEVLGCIFIDKSVSDVIYLDLVDKDDL